MANGQTQNMTAADVEGWIADRIKNDGEASFWLNLKRGTDMARVKVIVDSAGLSILCYDQADHGDTVAEAVVEVWDGQLQSLTWDTEQLGGDPQSHVLVSCKRLQQS